MSESTKITALAIVLNEAENISEYLKNIAFADEVIVVDSYSIDGTLEIIAREFPEVKVIQNPFVDFSTQRNFALAQATNDWILFLDADERITEKGILEIKNIVADTGNKAVAFWAKRLYLYSKKANFLGLNKKDKAIRFFRKSKCNYSDKLVHEQVLINGKSKTLNEKITHYFFENKEAFYAKNRHYSRLRAQELFNERKEPNFIHFYIKPAFRFIKHYFIEYGVLNGKNGLDFATILAKNVHNRYAFLEELYKKLNTDSKPKHALKIGYEAKRVFHNRTGLGNYSRDLIRILSSYYPKNQYFLYNPKLSKNNLFTPNKVVVFEKRPQSSFYKRFYNIWRQSGIVSDLKKDGVNIFHGLSGELPSGLRNANIKSVVTIHDLIFMRYPEFYSFFDRKIHFYKFKKATKNADVVIAISEQTKKDIVEFLKIDPSKIKVIYQGCQSIFKEEFTEEEKQEVAQKYNLPEKFLLNVGTIEARKNVLSVVKAIKDLNVKLVIIGGETKYTETVLSYIAQNSMQDQVLFLKNLNRKELAITYQLSTIFVYPSLFEGFGIPIIEALYSKTPVITTSSGVFPEAAGPDSVYVDPKNVEEIREKIELLLSNSQLRQDISVKGYNFVQKFDDATISKEIMVVYEELKTTLNI
jgi:glycosyltransferase involved in cell wall biosynthesis